MEGNKRIISPFFSISSSLERLPESSIPVDSSSCLGIWPHLVTGETRECSLLVILNSSQIRILLISCNLFMFSSIPVVLLFLQFGMRFFSVYKSYLSFKVQFKCCFLPKSSQLGWIFPHKLPSLYAQDNQGRCDI